MSLRRIALVSLALGLCSAGCTDSDLFGAGVGGIQADRVTLAGRVCAEDPLRAELPLKVVLLVDQAAGPLFSSFDVPGTRVDALLEFATRAVSRKDVEVAVMGFASRPRKLAPLEPGFTRDPALLEAAIMQTGLPQPCMGGLCRDYLEALRSARAIIEDDMAVTPAGVRVVSQYAIVLVVAGPETPMSQNIDCCDFDDAPCRDAPPAASNECQRTREQGEASALIAAADAARALGARLHVIHLAATAAETGDQTVDNLLETNLKEVAYLTGGIYQRFNDAGGVTGRTVDVLGDRVDLRVKALTVANLNSRPAANGPLVDSDADGMDDATEIDRGSDPTLADTDGDGITDLVETLVDFDALSPDMPQSCRDLEEIGDDQDLDGLNDCDELLLGTEPTLVDSDGDGLPDFIEVTSSTDYVRRDAELDADEDGTNNGEELRTHTDPRSTDTAAHLEHGYRYEIVDEGIVTEPTAEEFDDLYAVEVVSLAGGTSPGMALVAYDSVARTLSFRDAMDAQFGMPVPVPDVVEEIDLPSGSWAAVQGDEGRLMRVRVLPADLPDEDIMETIRVVTQTHQCLQYTVRNVRLMDTLETDPRLGPGLNRIVLFFGETAAKQITNPGPFRLAEVPVIFTPPNRRSPGAAIIEINDDEFFLPRF